MGKTAKKDDKSIRKNYSGGEKFSTDVLRRAYVILLHLREGMFPTQVASRMKVSRERLTYWIRILEDEGQIYCTNPRANKYKQYKLTPAGEKFLVTNESTVPKNKRVTVENARFKCYIRNQNNFLPFLQHKPYNFKKTDGLRNNVVYDGKIDGVNIRLIHGARHIDKVTMIMTSPQFYASTGKEANYIMYKTMLEFQDFIDKQWNLDLSRIDLDSSHVEYTWESPFAKEIMTKTGGAPVKTAHFTINQSPPSLRPKEEWHDASELDKHLMLPDVVDSLRKTVENLKGDTTEITYKIDEFEKAVRSISESSAIMANAINSNNEHLANLTVKLTDLVNSFQSKNNSSESKIEENANRELSSDASRMFS